MQIICNEFCFNNDSLATDFSFFIAQCHCLFSFRTYEQDRVPKIVCYINGYRKLFVISMALVVLSSWKLEDFTNRQPKYPNDDLADSQAEAAIT